MCLSIHDNVGEENAMPAAHSDKTLPQKEPDRMQQSQAGTAGYL